MRIVRFTSQERVDLPDLQAISTLALGEFRRLFRAAITGHEVSGIIRGFRVQAQTVPDTTARVVLDAADGTALSVAVGTAEGVHGQLIGEQGPEGLEGNATYTIDFNGQPIGTYYVEMSCAYANSESDNRVFWNAATNTEFTQSVPTRRIPVLSFQLAASPTGGDWIPLARVQWDGATVNSGDIDQDLRPLLFEGAQPWFQTSQEGSGGMPDFSRSSARGNNTTDEVYTALRKIGRQIQDIKGPTTLGRWSFWGRVTPPLGTSGFLSSQRTKSIDTLDTLEFVVGDGTTTWGDFYGTDGLQQCLSHIEAAQANLPTRIRIRLKSRQSGSADYLSAGSSGTPIWSCDQRIVLTQPLHLEIVADVAKVDRYGRAPVEFVHTGGAMITHNGASGSVTLRNIAMSNTPSEELFRGFNTRINLHNCALYASSSSYVIRSHGAQLLWEHSEVYGSVQIYHSAANQDIDGFYMRHTRLGARTCFGVATGGYLRLWGDASYSDDATAGARTSLSQASFQNCEFSFTGLSAATNARPAAIDLRGAINVTFDACELASSSDSNLVLLGTIAVSGGYRTSSRISWRNCVFTCAQAVDGDHQVDAGYNGTVGTGWSVYGTTDPTLIDTGSTTDLDNLVIDTVTFANCAWNRIPHIDSGAVFMRGMYENVVVSNCRFYNAPFATMTFGANKPRVNVLRFQQTQALAGARNPGRILVENCTFGRVGYGTTVPRVWFIRARGNERGLAIKHCTFGATDRTGTALPAGDFSEHDLVGVGLENTTSMGTGHTVIDGCTFRYFETNGVFNFTSAAVLLDSAQEYRLTVADCFFDKTSYGLLARRPSNAALGDLRVLMRGCRMAYENSLATVRCFARGDFPANAQVTIAQNTGVGTWGSSLGALVLDTQCDNVIIANNSFNGAPITPGTYVPLDATILDSDHRIPGEYRYSATKTRTFLVPLLEGIARDDGDWLIDSLDKEWQTSNPSEFLCFPVKVPNGAVITNVRALTHAASSVATEANRMSLALQVITTASAGDNTLTTDYSANRPTDATGFETIDLAVQAGLSSETVNRATRDYWILVRSDNSSTTNRLLWIEITYQDPGYRGL